METTLAILVPVAAFALFMFAGYKAIKANGWAPFWGIAGLWSAFTLTMLFALNAATGWDGLIYVIGLLFISAPSAIGTGLGALVGWVKQRNKSVEAFT